MKRTVTFILLLLTAFTLSTMAASTPSDTQLWLQTAPLPPAFKLPESKRKWEAQRPRIRAELWELLGNLPDRPRAPQVEVLSREDRAEYTLEKFQFDNGAGAKVPGYFVLPRNVSGKVPAILYCHWHGGEYEIGKEEIFQAKHTPEIPVLALTRLGFAVMAVDAYCFGERHGKVPGGETRQAGELTASKFQMWVGRSLWGMILRDDLMALDYLAQRPEVDARKIGAMGMSMGATRTWWLMALDERIRTGVSICCLTRYQDLVEQDLLKAHGIYYYVPGLFARYDMESVVALIAPRPVLFMDGDRDATAPVTGVRKIHETVRPVWRLYGKESAFEGQIYEGQGHLYTPEMWQKTLRWFESTLK